MRHPKVAFLALAASVLTLSCLKTSMQLPAADEYRARKEAQGQARFLRVALNAGPLWGDTDKVYLTDLPAPEVDLVEMPGGKPIPPPAFEKVLAPGTPVRVQQIEFPDTFVVAQRVLVSPRLNPWVYLQVEGDTRTFILVLPQEMKNLEDVRAELERYLSQEDVRPAFAAFPYEIPRGHPAQGGSPRHDLPGAGDGLGAAGAKARRPARRHRGVDLGQRKAARLPSRRRGGEPRPLEADEARTP